MRVVVEVAIAVNQRHNRFKTFPHFSRKPPKFIGLSSLTLKGKCKVEGKEIIISGDIDGDKTSIPCNQDGLFTIDVDVKNKEEGRSLILEQSDNEGNTTTVGVHLGKFCLYPGRC